MPTIPNLQPVESLIQRQVAGKLIREYLEWVAAIAQSNYNLSFDIEAMVASDLEDASKFYPPTGRFYLVEFESNYIGVGCLKRLSSGVGEIQRMYVQAHVRGVGAGRMLVLQLLVDAKTLGYSKVRLESLKALEAAHGLYHSVGFRNIDPYADNSMRAYQQANTFETYHASAVFMEICLENWRSDS
jgi:N-acetylglutamate synthase-like GNAT family acetyltransferase